MLPPLFGLKGTAVDVTNRPDRPQRVHLPGYPLSGGLLTRVVLLQARGREWYERHFIPRISPIP